MFTHGIAWVLLAIAALTAAANWQILWLQFRAKGDASRPSFVPFVGGALGVIALAMLDVAWRWRWVPLLADFGAGPYILFMMVAVLASLRPSPPPPPEEPP